MSHAKRESPGTFQLIAALFVLFALLVGICAGIAYAFKILLVLPKELAVALIAATVVPIGSVTSLAIGKYLETRRTIEQEIRAKKTVVYEKLLAAWFDVLFDKTKTKDEDGNMKPEFVTVLIAINRELIIWGSDEALRRWSRMRRRSSAFSTPEEMLAELEQLLLSIRTDIGHANKTLASGDVVGMFVNDVPIPTDAAGPSLKLTPAAVSTEAPGET